MKKILRIISVSLLLILVLPGQPQAAGPTLSPEASAALDALLGSADKSSTPPGDDVLAPLLDFFFAGQAVPADYDPPARAEGDGTYFRSSLAVPLSDVLHYLYNPGVPSEAMFPASIRRGAWLKGSDILELSPPLWERLKGLKDRIVLRGAEYEEIAPDDFSGSYYKYNLDRLLILTSYKGKTVLLSVSWQRGQSDVGKKAASLGGPETWDFIYTSEPGMTTQGIGWMDTYMYKSCSVMAFFDDPAKSGATGYGMLKWLNAGWSGLNVVKSKHIRSGAERSFNCMKSILESPRRPPADAISTEVRRLYGLSEDNLRAELAPYCQAAEAKSKDYDVPARSEFQSLLKDGGYCKSLSRQEMIAQLLVSYMKRSLGLPVLGG